MFKFSQNGKVNKIFVLYGLSLFLLKEKRTKMFKDNTKDSARLSGFAVILSV